MSSVLSVVKLTPLQELFLTPVQPSSVTRPSVMKNTAFEGTALSGFRVFAFFHPHLDLPPSRGKKSEEVELLAGYARNDV